MSPRRPILALALLVAACGATPPGSDDDRPGPGADDPVLRTALLDPIMIDPGLAQQANADVVRPPPQPLSAMLPPDDIAARPVRPPAGLSATPPASGACADCRAVRSALTLAALAESRGARAACVAGIGYAAGWSMRLPPAALLYPDARVIEAAGTDAAGCALRAVTFATAAPVRTVLDFYYTRATAAGYRAQHGADGTLHILAATGPAGGSVTIVLTPRVGGGTKVDLVADGAA